VRAEDQPAAEHRLKSMLFYYFESEFTQLFGNRLFVVNGDITTFDHWTISPLDNSATPPNSEIVKLSNREIVKLSNRQIDTVFNCAANVKHFSKGTDIEDVNIGGALRCVEFCLKTGARLVHISTTSVAESMVDRGDGSEVPRLDERKLWFGQSLDNRYVHSKFLAERLVLDAVAHHGLSAKVMRVGNLAPRNSDGEFQVNFNSNSYMGRLKVFHMLGCCPYDSYDQQTEMSPVDDTAKAVVLLASTPKECTVFQPFNNHTELLGDVLRMMEKVGREMRFVESTEFERAIVIAGQDSEKSKQLSALLAYQNFGLGQKTIFIERDNRYTCSVLHRLGFHWRDTSWDYVERMLTAISGLGFFDA
jgi:thioester reductase-like protein